MVGVQGIVCCSDEPADVGLAEGLSGGWGCMTCVGQVVVAVEASYHELMDSVGHPLEEEQEEAVKVGQDSASHCADV